MRPYPANPTPFTTAICLRRTRGGAKEKGYDQDGEYELLRKPEGFHGVTARRGKEKSGKRGHPHTPNDPVDLFFGDVAAEPG